MVERVSDKDKVEGPIPSTPTNRGPLAQLVRALDLHSKGHQFESGTVHIFQKTLKRVFHS